MLLVVPALLAQTLLTFGLGCFAATVTTFVRDPAHAIGVALTVLFYATPIVYPAALVPSRYRGSSRPIRSRTWSSGIAAPSRSTCSPDASSVLYLTVFRRSLRRAGLPLFVRARPHFADLI